jgi:hypothetical protein
MRGVVSVTVVVLVALAGCSPVASQGTETITPAPPITTERPSPPGVSVDRIRPSVLVDAHATRLAATNYTLVVDPEDAPREVFDAPDEWDCNYRGVEMSVPPDGGLHVVILQSVVLCQNSDGGWGWSLSSTIGRNV